MREFNNLRLTVCVVTLGCLDQVAGYLLLRKGNQYIACRHIFRVRMPKRNMCSRTVDTASGSSYPQQRQQRGNRPGYNSYLKLVIDQRTMAHLNTLTLNLKHSFESPDVRQKADPHAAALTNPSGLPPRLLSIQPRSLQSLHLTFFFAGEILCNMSVDDLTSWHAKIEEQLAASGFRLRKDFSEVGESETSVDEKYWLTIKEFRLFPPRRNYLIVAVLDASPAWHKLYDDIRKIAKLSECQALSEIVHFSKDVWVPHITVANVEGRSVEERNLLNSLLDQLNMDLTNSSNDARMVEASLIGMGGPIPNSANLDWNFYPVDPYGSTKVG